MRIPPFIFALALMFLTLLSVADETSDKEIAELKQRIAALEAKQAAEESALNPPAYKSLTPSRSNGYIRGPRGGCYTFYSSGRKKYVDRSLCD